MTGLPYCSASLFAVAEYRRGAHLPDDGDDWMMMEMTLLKLLS